MSLVRSGAVYEYTVDVEFNATVEDYLKTFHNYSSRVISSLKRNGALYLNGTAVFFVVKVKKGDRIKVVFPEEEADCPAKYSQFEVLYEDEDVLVVNKPFNLVTHSTLAHPVTTLSAAIYYHWMETGYQGKVRFVNRLDMDTSGIVIVAKNRYVHHFIQSEAKAGKTMKMYKALCCGVVKEDHGIIDAPIGRIEEFSPVRIVREDGQRAVTEYDVEERYENYTLVNLRLHTGKTHQIRVHMKYLGNPVAGDALYESDMTLIQRQALHAYRYSFTHPRTKEHMVFTCPIPEDMKKAIESAKYQQKSI